MERLILSVETRHANSTWRREFFSIHRESSVPKPIVHNIVADPVPALSPRLHHASDTHASTLRQIVSPPSCLAAFCPYAFAKNLHRSHRSMGSIQS